MRPPLGIDTTGRYYALPGHTLPSARGQGEPATGRLKISPGALFTDVVMTIPPLLVLIVIQAAIGNVELYTMAVLIALFEWPKPTRQIRAQVMSMRESGYVATAVMSGASTLRILFLEIAQKYIRFNNARFASIQIILFTFLTY